MTRDTLYVKMEVLREDGFWFGHPIGGRGCASGDTLGELFADAEFSKHDYADVAEDVPVRLEYVAGDPEFSGLLNTVYTAYCALPASLRPVAVAWDNDNDRPQDPAWTGGPYTNSEQLRYLEQIQLGA